MIIENINNIIFMNKNQIIYNKFFLNIINVVNNFLINKIIRYNCKYLFLINNSIIRVLYIKSID